MGQDIIFFIACTVITTCIGIVAYFLKRTMSRGDKNEEVVSDLKDNFSRLPDKFTAKKESEEIKEDISALKDKFSDLSEKFATKEEVREIKDGMKEMSKNMDYIRENTIRKDDLVRTLTRLENKVDNLRGN